MKNLAQFGHRLDPHQILLSRVPQAAPWCGRAAFQPGVCPFSCDRLLSQPASVLQVGPEEHGTLAKTQAFPSSPLPPPLQPQTVCFLAVQLLLGCTSGLRSDSPHQKLSPRQRSPSQTLGCTEPSNSAVSGPCHVLPGCGCSASPGGSSGLACSGFLWWDLTSGRSTSWEPRVCVLLGEPQEREGVVPIAFVVSSVHREVKKFFQEHTARQRQLRATSVQSCCPLLPFLPY